MSLVFVDAIFSFADRKINTDEAWGEAACESTQVHVASFCWYFDFIKLFSSQTLENKCNLKALFTVNEQIDVQSERHEVY